MMQGHRGSVGVVQEGREVGGKQGTELGCGFVRRNG